jgi:hypothetical protein
MTESDKEMDRFDAVDNEGQRYTIVELQRSYSDEVSATYCSAARKSIVSRMTLSKSSRQEKFSEKSANETSAHYAS